MPDAGFNAETLPPDRLFLSRELSWIDFDARVLEEAACRANPLLERLKFIAIAADNLDEFFMVRIAGLRRLVRNGDPRRDPAGLTAPELLARAREKIDALLERQYELLNERLLPELEKEGVFILHPDRLTDTGKKRAAEMFRRDIMPALTPLAADPARPFPQINAGAIEIALRFIPAGKTTESLAFVEVPEVLDRFQKLPGTRKGKFRFLLLEELILANLEQLFPGGRILERLCFRITRDMDFSMDGANIPDLPEYIARKLLQRNRRSPVRLELPAPGNGPLARQLRAAFAPEELDCFTVPGPLKLKQFAALADLPFPELKESPHTPVEPPEFSGSGTVFAALRARGEILIAPPYHAFGPVIRLLEEAACDPEVLAIKQTLYRVSGNSPVVRALQQAALNGKQVTVVLELRARFDEENNIAWAQALDSCGAHVVCGIPGLKVHAKALLIVRRESGKLRRYCHLGSGNYNDRTVRTYTDVGIMSCDRKLCADVARMFNILSGGGTPERPPRKAFLAPWQLRAELERLFEDEIRRAESGGRGEIIAKMNGLADERMIRLIHRAAAAGVKITLLVRGICCCRPLPEEKELRIISIVDRFLEHSRIFWFAGEKGGAYYLSSADWMTRNLDRRVELMFPVEDPALREQLRKVLELHIADDVKGRRLLPEGVFTPVPDPERYGANRSQTAIAAYFRERALSAATGPAGKKNWKTKKT